MPCIETTTAEIPFARIYLWKITETAEELAKLANGGHDLLAVACSKFASPKRRLEWLATRALLQHTPCKDSAILYHSNGKPYLGDSHKHISISHTQGYAAIAVADTPVGIDIELESRSPLAVAQAYLQPQETAALQGSSTPAAEALRLWTVKEAAFKLQAGSTEVLKDIAVEQSAVPGIYDITYRCGATATAITATAHGLVISCSTAEPQ